MLLDGRPKAIGEDLFCLALVADRPLIQAALAPIIGDLPPSCIAASNSTYFQLPAIKSRERNPQNLRGTSGTYGG